MLMYRYRRMFMSSCPPGEDDDYDDDVRVGRGGGGDRGGDEVNHGGAATVAASSSSSPTNAHGGSTGSPRQPPSTSSSSSSSSKLRMRTAAAAGRRRHPSAPTSTSSGAVGGGGGGGRVGGVARDDSGGRGGRRMMMVDGGPEDRHRLQRHRQHRRRLRLRRTKLLFNVVVAASAVCLTYWLAAARRRRRRRQVILPPHPRIAVVASASASASDNDVYHVYHAAEVISNMGSSGKVLIVEPPPWDPNSSDDYLDMDRREHPPEGCRWMHDWQSATLTTCNLVHEQRILGYDYNKMLGQGGFRDGWRLRMGTYLHGHEEEDYEDDDDEVVVLKTLRWNYESHSNWYMERYYEMHRADAVVSDKLTWSTNVVDIYGNCGTSGLYEFAQLGDLQNYLRKYHVDGWERLSLAHQVALAVADLHDPDGIGNGGRPAFAHNDLSMGQFVITDDFHVKIHDFNCARFFTVKRDDPSKLCPVGRGSRSYFGAEYFRSPEELTTGLVTERVDLYSMGNVFYVLLTDGMHPYEGVNLETGMDMIRRGIMPYLPEELEGGDDSVVVALRRAMDMCRTYDPTERSTAAEVASFLDDALAELEMHMDGEEENDGEEKEDASSEDAAGYDGDRGK